MSVWKLRSARSPMSAPRVVGGLGDAVVRGVVRRRTSRVVEFLALASFVLPASLACACAASRPPAAPAAASLPAGIVASVGARTLSLEVVRRRVVATAAGAEPCPEGVDRCAEPAKRLVRRALEDAVNELLLAHHAEQIGVRVEPREIEEALAKMAARARLSTDELLAAARRQEIDADELRRLLEAQALVAKFWDRGPGEGPSPPLKSEADKRAAMAATYAEWKAEPGHARADVRVLAFYAAAGDEKYVSDSLTALRARAEGGEDFCELVKTYAHDDASRNSCGSVGPLPVPLLLPEIRAVVEAMKPMEIVGPLRVRDGFVLVQLVDRPHPPPLEEVTGEIWRLTVERVHREALTTWLRGLGRRYGIRGGELSRADAAMLEAEVLRARHLRTPEERAREVETSLATEIIRNALRDAAATRAPSP